jgi:hypothetical protein
MEQYEIYGSLEDGRFVARFLDEAGKIRLKAVVPDEDAAYEWIDSHRSAAIGGGFVLNSYPEPWR